MFIITKQFESVLNTLEKRQDTTERSKHYKISIMFLFPSHKFIFLSAGVKA